MLRIVAGGRSAWRLLPMLIGLAMLLPSSAAAESQSPWFVLSSQSRPGNLHGGVEKSEVQELTAGPEAAFILKVAGTSTEVAFQSAPYDFGSVRHLVAKEVQAVLETVYGAGNVEVTGQGAEGLPPLTVRSVGADTDRSVDPLAVHEVFGEASTRIVASGEPDGELVLTAVNVGDATADVEADPITLTDRLPEHLRALYVEANARGYGTPGVVRCEVGTVSCVFDEGCHPVSSGCPHAKALLPPFDEIEMVIGVEVQPEALSGERNEATVSGGGAPPASTSHPIVISPATTPFGVETYELAPEDSGGEPDTQAGSHPFQLTTTFDLAQRTVPANGSLEPVPVPAALAKNLSFELPPGLIGNPTAYPRCSVAQFSQSACPSTTVLGVAAVTVYEKIGLPGQYGLSYYPRPIYNLEPSAGEPARFGFLPTVASPVFLNASVRTGGDYGVTVSVENIPQTVGFISNTVTFWGVPGSSAHNAQRGLGCLEEVGEVEHQQYPCEAEDLSAPAPFLTMPTSCSGAPLQTRVSASSWIQPEEPVSPSPDPSAAMPTLDGCGLLPFGAEIKALADEETASTPSGLEVDVHVPQENDLSAQGLADAQIKNIKVTLPEGLELNPAASDGLQACSEEQAGLHDDSEAACPDASKIATVTIHTPLLPNPLTGFVYLASPQNFAGPLVNPFGSLVAMYLIAKDKVSGTLVKLAGNVSLSPSGQITSTFEDNPQLPFEDAEIDFFGGERAPLSTPTHCGIYKTDAVFEPWSDGGEIDEALTSSSTFTIAAGAGGSACPGAALPFNPSLASESTNVNAGGFTPLSTTLTREDGQQPISSVTLHYPAGLSGLLSGVKLCGESEADAGTCGPESQIGETIVSVGVGGDPFTVTGGKVYITGPYNGHGACTPPGLGTNGEPGCAPFGLSIVNPAKAGPFDLQEGRPVIVRAKIEINPQTAALTIATNPAGTPYSIPAIIEGIPLQIQHVNVLVNGGPDHQGAFTFNPTSCNPTKIEGEVKSAEGATSPISVPFQVTNCASLKFEPKFSASTTGKTSKTDGASLTAKVTEPAGSEVGTLPGGTQSSPGGIGSQANIAKVKVELPKQLPSRLTTLQRACTAKQFELNPAACPAESKIGYAVVHTPLLPVPLEGPAIFVSHGGEAFPSLTMVLQGYGVTIELVGTTFISKSGVTSTTFKTVPDQPFSSFQLTLPQGKYSALAANGNLCKPRTTVTSLRRSEKVKVKVHGREKTETRKVKETVAAPLAMPTEFVAQNGAVIKQTTAISVTGCPRHKAAHRAKKKHHKAKRRKPSRK